MSKKSIWKTAISYIICLALSWILIEATWGTTVGSLVGIKASDKTSQQVLSKIFNDKSINETDVPKSIFGDDEWYKNLPPDVQSDLENVAKSMLQNINWFGVTIFVSAFVFAIVGFLSGFVNRNYLLVGLIPTLSFFINNPLVRFNQAIELNLMQKLIIVLFFQFVVCYLFGYFGVLFGKKRDKKLLLQRGQNENQENETV